MLQEICASAEGERAGAAGCRRALCAVQGVEEGEGWCKPGATVVWAGKRSGPGAGRRGCWGIFQALIPCCLSPQALKRIPSQGSSQGDAISVLSDASDDEAPAGTLARGAGAFAPASATTRSGAEPQANGGAAAEPSALLEAAPFDPVELAARDEVFVRLVTGDIACMHERFLEREEMHIINLSLLEEQVWRMAWVWERVRKVGLRRGGELSRRARVPGSRRSLALALPTWPTHPAPPVRSWASCPVATAARRCRPTGGWWTCTASCCCWCTGAAWHARGWQRS